MKNRTKRGTALMMVIGLLCILLVLGASFLVVTHMDAQQSSAIAQKNQGDPVVGGIVQQLQMMLANGLYISSTLPYTRTTPATPYPMLRYVDAATSDTESTTWNATLNKFDIWLGSSCTVSGGTWPHVTNLYSSASTAFVNIAASNASLVDTDNDGVNDAYLYDTGVVGTNGQRYYAAVRVIDTSGLLNVNIAGSTTSGSTLDPMGTPNANWPAYISPVAVDLNSFLSLVSAGYYPSLHASRCTYNGALSSTLATDYNTGAALRVVTPSGNYRPYGVNDEVTLRWSSTLTRSASTSRFWRDLPSLPTNSYLLPLLTTYSCSRALPRAPQTTNLSRVNLSGTGNALDNAGTRTFLQQSLTAARVSDVDTAHFVANLWAALDSDINVSTTKSYAVTQSTTTAYGVIPQPVITEGFATCVKSSTTPNSGQWLWGVEIFNPYPVALPMTNYSFGGPSGTVSFSGLSPVVTSLAPGSRVVLFDSSAVTSSLSINIDPNWRRIGTNNYQLNAGTYWLSRTAGGVTIKMDGITASANPGNQGLIWNSTTISSTTSYTQQWWDARRDDSTTRNRYLGWIFSSNTGANNVPSQTLGTANEDLSGDPALSGLYPGYTLDTIKCSPTQYLTFGLVAKMFLVGPEAGNNNCLTGMIASGTSNQITRKKVDFRGTVLSNSATSTYPDVPFGTLLAELLEVIPGDTRSDDPAQSRIYGRINVNTAYVDPTYSALNVLRYLPWPTQPMTVTPSGASSFAITMQNTPGVQTSDTIGAAIEYILAYRDMRAVSWPSITIGGTARTFTRSYVTRATGSNLANLRANTPLRAYLTPGEVAIPLADFMNDLMGWSAGNSIERAPEYLAVRDSLYHAVGNCLTTNSDTYFAYIFVIAVPQGSSTAAAMTDPTVLSWRYVALLDRSNCRNVTDQPAVLLLSPVYR